MGLIDKHFPLDKSSAGDNIFSSFDQFFTDFDRPRKKRSTFDVYYLVIINLCFI